LDEPQTAKLCFGTMRAFNTKQTIWVLAAMALVALAATASYKSPIQTITSAQPIALPENPQLPGDAAEGYQYLVYGDYLKSGIPLGVFNLTRPRMPDYLQRQGENAGVPYSFNIVNAPNGARVAAPNCLYCHAQVFEDSLIIGLGNSLADFSQPVTSTRKLASSLLMSFVEKDGRDAARNLLKHTNASAPYMVTASKGVNIADRLTAVLAAHRDPASFKWLDSPAMQIPEEVIPTDVPAWWLLKKKKGMFYTGFGRGDFPRFLMAANLLTVTDTTEAVDVLPHFYDVLAYLYSLEAPKYPKAVNEKLAAAGKALFENNCSKCHGTYGPGGQYPNLLVPTHIVQTDSALVESNFSHHDYVEWFYKSWFAGGSRPAKLVAYRGYIAPPLDGVWATAPYLHNGSVPTLEALLNSKLRPEYWERNFSKPKYDYEIIGWQYREKPKQENRSTYNTTLKGYGNHGHTFGDKLSDEERKALLEYLKTL